MHAPFTVNSSGTKIVVEVQGDGPPVVFAHGLTGTRHTTQAQLAPLCERYSVVSFDQRGHGDSMPLIEAAAYDVSLMAEDMASVLDALGIERAVIGGESMGSASAVVFALRYPERVSRLLLTAPAFGDEESTEKARFHKIAAAIREVGLKNFVAAAQQTWTNDFHWPANVVDTVSASFLAHNAESIAMAIDEVMEWVPLHDIDALAQLTVPTCIIYWKDDALHPSGLAERLAEILPNVRLVEIPSLPFIFEHADRIGAIYQEFLDDVA